MKVIANHLANRTPHLTPGQTYILVGITNDFYRVIDNSGEPALFARRLFHQSDAEKYVPANWIRTDFEDGEYFIDPPGLGEPGFYEDWFDGVNSAREVLARYLATNETN